MDSFPAVAESSRHSSDTGLHEIDFMGKLEYWDKSTDEVQVAFYTVLGSWSYITGASHYPTRVWYSLIPLSNTTLPSSWHRITHVMRKNTETLPN
ncbi:hypothetical protein BJX66DRAFT_30547 [Aspergillus keveii]|uniref:Uncharacterized protein n=1 Tax=Aspergillus keveii TaxID=714993 RepID=A0ABR4FTC3_9EURO